MNHSDEFDRILDQALAEYRDAQPLSGFAERVLQRMQAKAQRRQKLWWQWVAVAAAAAVVIIAAWIAPRYRMRHAEVPSAPAAGKQAPPIDLPPKPEVQTAGRQPTMEPRRTLAASRAPVRPRAPMPAQFPSPQPLKPEERVLLALANTNPDALSPLAAEQDEKEIAIQPITIKPLAEDAGEPEGDH